MVVGTVTSIRMINIIVAYCTYMNTGHACKVVNEATCDSSYVYMPGQVAIAIDLYLHRLLVV